MKRSPINAGIPLALGLGLTLGLLRLLGGNSPAVLAQGPDGYSTYYVATSCVGVPEPCYTAVQAAVDATDDPDDVVKVATGIYASVQARPAPISYPNPPASGLITQVVYISRTVTVRGGYTTAFTEPPDPEANPTVLDAEGKGRVLFISSGISPTIEGLHLTAGDAAGLGGSRSGDSGGGVLAIGARMTISRSRVVSNAATFGGGFYFHNSANATLRGNTISHNQGWTHAGGLYFSYSPTATLVANTISHNVADHQGGGSKHFGAMRFDHSDNATLISNTISDNYAANTCGGVCIESSHSVTLIGNVIVSNTARQQGFVGGGAGVYLRSSRNVSLLNNTIMYNGADGDIGVGHLYGGGVYIGSNTTAVLTDNTINANEATTGGGVYLTNSDGITLSYNSIGNNYAASGGGGIYMIDASPALRGNQITNNYAVIAGGGIYMLEASPTLKCNRIIGNVTPDDGGGIFIDNNSSPTLVNNVMARNRAGSNGGGIYIDFYSTPAITNNTIVANSLEGIFMFNSPSPTVVNNIVVTHAYGIRGVPLTIALDYNDVWACSTACYSGVSPGPHDISADPRFVDPANGDYHLRHDSPAIDTGTDAGAPATDVDDEPRPLDGDLDGAAITDMGSDEFSPHPGLTVTKVASPNPAPAGGPVIYTIRVANTGNLNLHATVTDTLPAHVTTTGALIWTTGAIAPDDTWTKQFVATVEMGYIGPLTNVVQVATDEGVTGVYTATSTSVRGYPFYLPLVLR
ncbi:MAG: right-handed parallel beta-helix repeat-containing protein [Anaerolineae bacterium]|nr:MAG: right-handed parallel beta-helix repeat-containing protein [Anaerolineae bacterium]